MPPNFIAVPEESPISIAYAIDRMRSEPLTTAGLQMRMDVIEGFTYLYIHMMVHQPGGRVRLDIPILAHADLALWAEYYEISRRYNPSTPGGFIMFDEFIESRARVIVHEVFQEQPGQYRHMCPHNLHRYKIAVEQREKHFIELWKREMPEGLAVMAELGHEGVLDNDADDGDDDVVEVQGPEGIREVLGNDGDDGDDDVLEVENPAMWQGYQGVLEEYNDDDDGDHVGEVEDPAI